MTRFAGLVSETGEGRGQILPFAGTGDPRGGLSAKSRNRPQAPALSQNRRRVRCDPSKADLARLGWLITNNPLSKDFGPPVSLVPRRVLAAVVAVALSLYVGIWPCTSGV